MKCSTISKENAMLGTPICLFFLFIRGQNQYWEHPFACSFYFYFDNFKKQKTTIAPMGPSIFFVENEINFFFSTLNREKKINVIYLLHFFGAEIGHCIVLIGRYKGGIIGYYRS